jgi:hypothetical protein
MKDVIYLGSAPVNETPIQTTDPDFNIKGREECQRYVNLLYKHFVEQNKRNPECTIKVKKESHDFGSYFEAVAEYRSDNETSVNDAFWLEENSPSNW